MSLSETARERLRDVWELQPTSNGELQDRWGMSSGKDVAAYLDVELGAYTYRDDESRVRVVEDAPIGGDASDPDGAGGGGPQDAADGDSAESAGQDDAGPSEEDGAGETASAPKGADPEPVAPSGSLAPSDHALDGGEVGDSAGRLEATGGQLAEDPTHTMPTTESADGGGTPGADDREVPAAAESGCPSCSGELVDTRSTDTLAAEDGSAVPTPDDFYCSVCGQGFNESSGAGPSRSGGASVERGGLFGWVVGGVAVLAAGVLAAVGVLGRSDSDSDIETF